MHCPRILGALPIRGGAAMTQLQNQLFSAPLCPGVDMTDTPWPKHFGNREIASSRGRGEQAIQAALDLQHRNAIEHRR
jgi:hypothetical protein